MLDDIVVKPMGRDFLLWRCLHGGPLSRDTIDTWEPADRMPWARYRARNVPLLAKLTDVYGACGILAWDGDAVVGSLRFYPRAVLGAEGAGWLCIQQDHPAGPVDDFAGTDFPPLLDLDDRTLEVHCMMVGAPGESGGPLKRRGLASRMVQELVRWASERGWETIVANSFEDIPILYEITGCAGHTFWEKLGFHVVDRFPHPHLQHDDDFTLTIDRQAEVLGVARGRARDRIVMRLDLVSQHAADRG